MTQVFTSPREIQVCSEFQVMSSGIFKFPPKILKLFWTGSILRDQQSMAMVHLAIAGAPKAKESDI